MKFRTNLFFILAFAIPILSHGWAQKGHDVTAHIAERHLTDKARHTVDSIFNGKSLVYWSNWMDNASHTDDFAYTLTWHYRNIDEGQTYEDAPRNTNGDMVSAITAIISELKSDTISKHNAELALRMLAHLVADLHNPMHMGHASDLGGTIYPVSFFGKATNLHSVWDFDVVESAHNWSYSEWAEQIDILDKNEINEIVKGDAETWGKGTYLIGKEIYDTTPPNYEITYDYIAKWAPTIENQLLLGGLRLASILNSIWQ